MHLKSTDERALLTAHDHASLSGSNTAASAREFSWTTLRTMGEVHAAMLQPDDVARPKPYIRSTLPKP